MRPNGTLSPNRDGVVGEVIDGEAIVIDLGTGAYYSLGGVGGLIWSLIEKGRSFDEIATAIVAGFEVSRERAEEDLERVVAELVGQQLVVAGEHESPERPDGGTTAEPRQPYEAPELKVYRDMGDLLALDPHLPNLQGIPWQAPGERRLG